MNTKTMTKDALMQSIFQCGIDYYKQANYAEDYTETLEFMEECKSELRDRLSLYEEMVSEDNYILIIKAFEMAWKAHKNQTYGIAPFIIHPLLVSSLCNDWKSKIVGMLHDTIEDTEIKKDDIEVVFGEEISDAVVALTHNKKDETYDEYIVRVSKNDLAKKVKIADLRVNLHYSETSYFAEYVGQFYSLSARYSQALKALLGE